MSQDGADLNMAADGAVKAALGGEQPERMSDEDFAAMIRGASNAGSYGGCANVIARGMLEHLERHPESAILDVFGLYDATKSDPLTPQTVRDAMAESTGFMAGWAANAARHILKLNPVANPAIIEI